MKSSYARHSLIAVLFAAATLIFHPGAFAIGPNYSGSWYNPEQSGHGFSLEYSVLEDGTPVVLAYWYVYDSEGNPIFLVGQGEPGTGDEVTLEFIAPHGMKFGSFDPDQTVREDGGTGVFTFTSEHAGVFKYQPSDWAVTHYGLSAIASPMEKLIGVAHPNLDPAPTGSPYHLMGLWSGRMAYDRGHAGNSVCHDADVLVSVSEWTGKTPGFIEVRHITVSRDGGSTSTSTDQHGFIQNNYVAGNFYIFDFTKHEFTLRFDDRGFAEGTWRSADPDSDCYGTWSFYRE